MLLNIFDLKEKTALITGASSGLGRRAAETLAQCGANIIGVARRKDHLESLKRDIEKIGPKCTIYCCDLANPEQLNSVFSAITFDHKIDILINAAGVANYTSVFEEDPDDQFNWILNVNTTALWHVTKHVVKNMKNYQTPGSIINIASINGVNVPATKASAYCISKAAVVHLTKQLVGELSPHNIRINAISPGLFDTEMTKSTLDNARKEIEHIIPVGFVAEPEDLDGTIMLLASNKASRYITGANIVIDGGLSWGGQLNATWRSACD